MGLLVGSIGFRVLGSRASQGFGPANVFFVGAGLFRIKVSYEGSRGYCKGEGTRNFDFGFSVEVLGSP